MKLNCHENARNIYPCWQKGHCFHYKTRTKRWNLDVAESKLTLGLITTKVNA